MLGVPAEKRRAVTQRWLAAALQTYPGSSVAFLLREKDPFRNPVGAALNDGIPVLVEELCGGMDSHRIAQGLEGIVRIRAVQDFAPREAIGFVFDLKDIVRGELAGQAEAIREMDTRIDEVALAAFDLFMRCREQVYQVRLSEAKREKGVLDEMRSRGHRG